MADFFDDLENEDKGLEHNKPFFAINRENEKEVHDWLIKTLSFLKKENDPRLRKIKNNYARYKGIQYREQLYTPRDQEEQQRRYMPQMVVPIIADIVDEKVARLLEVKPAVQCIPKDDETQDKVDAKIAKRFLNHINQVDDLDRKFRKAAKSAKIAGESFIVTVWDKNKGETILKAGETMTLADGVTVKGPLFEGDASNRNATALEVLYEQTRSWDEVEYAFFIEHDYTEKLKIEYPEKADQIHASKNSSIINFESMKQTSLEGKTAKIHFWHKKTKYLPEGYEACFTFDTLLKGGDLPYQHGELPLTRFIDNENEDEVSGESHIEKIKGIVSQYNNVKNIIIKNLMLMGNPKWFVDGGSVDDKALGNDSTIVKLKAGSRQPVLAQANPVSPQMFEFAQQLKEEAYQMGKSNSVVRGEPPPGVTAFVALQFVSESENRRISNDVASTNESIRLVYDKNLKVCGQFYKKDDKRTMLILGKDNRWTRTKFDPTTLAKPFSLVIQNSSALPESKALRTQFVLDMGQRFPSQFTESQVAEMLDLGQSEKLLDTVGRASRAAEDENEIILDGDGVPDPKEYEDHITHWKTHVAAMQEIGLKEQKDPRILENMIDHLTATEMLMSDQIMRSPAYGQLVQMQCPQFPLYYVEPPPPPPMPGAEMGLPPEALGGPGMGPMGPPMPEAQNPEIVPLPGDPAFSPVNPAGKQPVQPMNPGIIPA